jgi:hypothetical protein
MLPFDYTLDLLTSIAGAAREVIHLINPLWDDNGGSEWRAIEMYKALAAYYPVRLWSRFDPARTFLQRYPVELIRPWRGRWPIGGTFIFVGAYFRVGHWFKAALPRRTILIYNTFQPDRFDKAMARLEAWHRTPVEVVYTSSLLRRMSQRPGPVIESPIDLKEFVPRAQGSRGSTPFTVGRMSRDVATKHHAEDPKVYDALSNAGIALRVMGGTCLRDSLRGAAATSMLRAGSMDPAGFLCGLDCFYYRTSDQWLEAYGRVVFEAMACGLPVVCGRRGGYADYIAHGVNGFLFDTTEQAVALILRLRDDAALRDRLGRAARRTVEDIYCSRAWRNKVAFFLPHGRGSHRSSSVGNALDPIPSELP